MTASAASSASASTAPVRILLSEAALRAHGDAITATIGRRHGRPGLGPVAPPAVDDARPIDGRHRLRLARCDRALDQARGATGHAALLHRDAEAPSLRWTHTHSAGADRPVFGQLRQRGVTVTTSSGANASVVAQTALAGLLALARPPAADAGHPARAPLGPADRRDMPRDLHGQTATIVGWGPIGQQIGALLRLFGMTVVVVRQRATPAGQGFQTVTFGRCAGGAAAARTGWCWPAR